MTVSHAVVGGTRTRVVTQGEAGPVVLFLHGYTDSADTWHATFAALHGTDVRCVALDLPSHGQASSLARPARLASFDAFVAAAVRTYDDGLGVVLVGNSLGGLLSLRAAADRSLPLAGVLALGAPDDALHPLLASLPRTHRAVGFLLAIPLLPDRVLGRVAAAAYTSLAGTKAPVAYRTHLGRQRLRELVALGGAVIGELHGGAEPPNALNLPVVRVWGDRDRICPVAQHTLGRPGARLVEGLGHCPQVERPELVAGLVREVLALAAPTEAAG